MSSQILRLKIESPAYGNIYIARHEGKVVMVSGITAPGEIVDVTVEKNFKDYITASVSNIVSPSPERIKPECGYFGICGGCHLQHLTYELQIRLKEDILRDCLRRIAKADIAISKTISSENPWNYRIRGQFKISGATVGFYKEKTREIVNVEKCPIMTDKVNEYLDKARGLIETAGVKELQITSGEKTAALLKVTKDFPHSSDLNALAERFMGSGFSGLSVHTGEGRSLDFGDVHLSMQLEGIRYTASPLSFIQSNREMNGKIVRFLKEKLKLSVGDRILDLYAGGGNLSLGLAETSYLTCVEENSYAVEDGERNIIANTLNNCRFIKSSAEDFQADEKFHVILLDPPRPGVSNRAMENIFRMLPERIVYVSCNPATFARDLKKLLVKYTAESIRMADLFPQTFHIETIAFLKLK